ncbi:MAG TPA: PorP/SprF family type IX secretion system membrane protein [Saprospiraceae bacterium]|nr:PorP/SprF family type IX secretion system membrane protein [Saprospiraceae bacterium]
MKKIFILIFLMWAFILHLSAQDVHLSQFYTNHAMVNPALVGDHPGDNTITMNFRNQWPEINDPIQTGAVAFEKRMYNGLQEYQAGLLIVNDRFSPWNRNRFGVALSFGYPLKLGKHRITPGIQAGLYILNGDYSGRTTPNQWNYSIGEFDQGIGSMEPDFSENIQYPDIALGFTHSFPLGNKNRLRWGAAVHHLNQPNISIIDDEEMPMRYTGHLDADLNVNEMFVIQPAMRFTQTTATENLVFGSRFMFKQPGSFFNAIYTGAFYRSNVDYQDALIPVFGVVLKTIQIGVSYDFNVSELSSLGESKSTLEFSVRYQTPISSPDRFSVPCIRY